MPNQSDKLGALWVKTSAKGEYFSGEIEINGEKHRIVAFPNGYKDAEKKPDFIIYKSQPRDAHG